jgi:hypothetical protein
MQPTRYIPGLSICARAMNFSEVQYLVYCANAVSNEPYVPQLATAILRAEWTTYSGIVFA